MITGYDSGMPSAGARDDRVVGKRDTGRQVLAQLRRHQRHLYRAWQLKEDLLQRRGYGYRNLDTLTNMIYLCIGGIKIKLPTET